MTNTIGQFDFTIDASKPGDAIPFNPVVTIVLKRWTKDENHNAPEISPDLMTAGEIDGHIKMLKEDLDAVGRRAKVALAKAESKL